MPIPTNCSSTARVVDMDEVEENEFNLNVPRYVDTFEPEPRMDVMEALSQLRDAESARVDAERTLAAMLREAGYAPD